MLIKEVIPAQFFNPQLCLKPECIYSFFNHYPFSLFNHLSLNLGLDDILQRDSISSELADTLTELLNSHLVLVEVEAEGGLVVDVGLLLNIESGSTLGVELLGDGLGGVHELLEEVGLLAQNVLATGLIGNRQGDSLQKW